MSEITKIYLNDIWNLYFHDPFSEDWTVTSYTRISNISTIGEYWDNTKNLEKNINKGFFFLMREYVFPCWDDINNINGGCISIKILKEQASEFWEDLTIKLLGEDLLIDEKKEHWDLINGVSISPKKYFCIIKIWLKNDLLSDKKNYKINQLNHGEIFFTSNIESIHNDNTYKDKN